MSDNLYKAQILQNKIKEIILQLWDPIGIQDFQEAQDEYNAYIAGVYKLLISHKTENDIFDYLWWLETTHMGLIGDKQKTHSIAKQLVSLL